MGEHEQARTVETWEWLRYDERPVASSECHDNYPSVLVSDTGRDVIYLHDDCFVFDTLDDAELIRRAPEMAARIAELEARASATLAINKRLLAAATDVADRWDACSWDHNEYGPAIMRLYDAINDCKLEREAGAS